MQSFYRFESGGGPVTSAVLFWYKKHLETSLALVPASTQRL
jgi:hypothetical protein